MLSCHLNTYLKASVSAHPEGYVILPCFSSPRDEVDVMRSDIVISNDKKKLSGVVFSTEDDLMKCQLIFVFHGIIKRAHSHDDIPGIAVLPT